MKEEEKIDLVVQAPGRVYEQGHIWEINEKLKVYVQGFTLDQVYERIVAFITAIQSNPDHFKRSARDAFRS